MSQTPTDLTHSRNDSACDLVTVNEVAALLKTSPSWVYKRTYDTADPLPCIKLRGALRFRLADVERWLETHTKAPRGNSSTPRGVVRRAPRVR